LRLLEEDILHFRKEREDQARRVREAWEAISEKHKVEPLFSQKWWSNVRTYFPGWFGSFPWYFKMFIAGSGLFLSIPVLDAIPGTVKLSNGSKGQILLISLKNLIQISYNTKQSFFK
jgi:hypothetical protein